MSDEKALLQHLACVVPESSWFFRGHLQHVAEYLSRAGLALVPAADVPTPIQDAAADDLEWIVSNIVNMRWLRDMARAELARRAAKEAKGG